MNIHRDFVVLVSAAIPEGHLLQTKHTQPFCFIYPTDFSVWQYARVLECRSLGIYTSINQCMLRILCTYTNIYMKSINCRCMHWNLCSRKRGPSFVVHISWWLLHGPSALKHTFNHGLPAIQLYEAIKKNLHIQRDWMYKTAFVVVFPNSAEKCRPVYHLLDRWLLCHRGSILWDNRRIEQ